MGPTKSALLATALAAPLALAAAAPAARAADNQSYTFALVTHGQPGDSFWDIVRKGAEAAAKHVGARLIYQANPNAAGEAQLITNMVQQHVDGIALTLAFPDAEIPKVAQAQAQNIPVIGVNAGSDDWKKAKLLGFVGQDEIVAGEAVGSRLNDAGAKDVICVNQQQGAVQLAERCDGIAKTFKGKVDVLYVPGPDMASMQSRLVAKLQQDPNVDYVVTLGAPYAPTAVTAIGMAGSKAKVGTFDMSPRLVSLIQDGKVAWAIDQQPYVEGYLAIELLWLNKANGDVVGGGGPVLTGPAFVTKDNVDEVAKFAKAGTR